MQILCAWCLRDGQPGYMGEREPLDNPEPTHGICPRHRAQLLESLPSRSFPDAELLIVVRRDNTALCEELQRLFASRSRVKVILDRRVIDEHRIARTRRIRAGTISALGNFTIVRFTPRVSPVLDYA
jgi:hypothetical protein